MLKSHMPIKNKTLTVYLALLLGSLGAHRLYLKGWRDVGFWLHAVATAIGFVGFRRAFALGQDDQLSWLLAPFLGFSLFAACLAAIVYGLMPEIKWNKAYNEEARTSPAGYGLAGSTSGTTIFAVILALLLGATALMSAIAFTGQRYFEHAMKAV
jgi:hypothetical protein